MHQKSEFTNILIITLMTNRDLFLRCKDAPQMQIHKRDSSSKWSDSEYVYVDLIG
jgi:hypothetical protein